MLGDKEILANPGPGTYHKQDKVIKINQKFNSSEDRFENNFYKSKIKNNESVGPGS